MCSWATAAFVFCFRALMDAVWNRFLKLNSLLLLSKGLLMVSNKTYNLTADSSGLRWAITWLKTAFFAYDSNLFIKHVMVPKHVSAASSGIAEDYSNNNQLIWMSSVLFFFVVVVVGLFMSVQCTSTSNTQNEGEQTKTGIMPIQNVSYFSDQILTYIPGLHVYKTRSHHLCWMQLGIVWVMWCNHSFLGFWGKWSTE